MNIDQQLQIFLNLKNSLKSKISEDCYDFGFVLKGEETSTTDIALSLVGLIHGNEVQSVEVYNIVLQKILDKKIRLRHSVGFFLGNIEAAKKNVRFTERDLNRAFGTSSTEFHEDRLARRLEPLLMRSGLVLDMHQTIEKTPEPFFIFGSHKEGFQFAQYLDPNIRIVTYPLEARRGAGYVLTAFCAHKNIAAVTIELGQKGFEKHQAQLGVDIVEKALQLSNKGGRPQLPELDENQKISTMKSSILIGEDEKELLPGFKNFVSVKKGQILGRGKEGEFVAPVDALILFPKYGIARNGSKELCLLVEEVKLKEWLLAEG